MAPKFELTEADRQRARSMLQSVGISSDDRPIAVIVSFDTYISLQQIALSATEGLGKAGVKVK